MRRINLHNAKLGRRYLWTFFAVVVLVDLLLSMMLFFLYSGNQISNTVRYSTAQLEQVCTSTDILFESLESVSNQVISNTDTAAFLRSSSVDRLQEVAAGRAIRTVRTANPYFRYVTLYNSSTQRFVSSAYAGVGDLLDADVLLELLGDNPYVCIQRKIGEDYNVQRVKNAMVYTFIFPISIEANGEVDMVIIDVSDSYFDQAMESLRVSGTRQELILVDSQGNIISKMEAAGDQESFSNSSDSLISNLASAVEQATKPGSGNFSSQDSQGNRLLVTYATVPTAGWTVLNVLPYHTLLQGIRSLVVITLSLTVVTLGFGYIISRVASSQLYAPIQVLYENYVGRDSQDKKGNELELLSQAFSDMYSKANRLEQGLIASFNDSKNMYLRYLLFGEEKRVRASLGAYERLKIDLNSTFYTTILLECTPQTGEQDANLFICYYALENITRELISSLCKMEFLHTEENRFVVLLSLESDTLPPPVPEKLEYVASLMAREFQLDTTICIGNVVDSWANINLCYEQALISLSSKSSSHYRQVFFAGDSTESLSSDLYYSGMHTRLAEYIRAEDLDACAKEFDTALCAMQNISFRTVIAYFRHALMSLLDDFSVSFERDNGHFSQLMKNLQNLDDCQNVQALRGVVLSFLSELCQRLALSRKNSNQDAAQKVKDYIDQNFANPDLSLRMLADMVGLSPAYLGKVFTTVTTYSFNDYLNHVRTDKAAELLRNTKLPVSRISEEVGILNTNYFYSVFKRRFGMTPASFRKENRLQEGSQPSSDG